MHSKILSKYKQLPGNKSLQHWTELFLEHMLQIDHQFDPGHRIDHVKRVAKSAIELTEQEGALIEVVLPAAILHDTLPIGKFDKNRSMASTLSAEHSISLLEGWGYPSEYYPAIKDAILAHSFSAKIAPESLEAKVVQDADRLDALGAIGIARAMAVGFKHGNPLYLDSEPFPGKRSANDQTNILDHFYIKLFQLPDSFNTHSAKDEGKKRIATMENYLQALAHEVGDNYISQQEYCQLIKRVTLD